MDALTQLLAILLPLSGLFLALSLLCAGIERWSSLAASRPRRAPARIQEPRRRTRVSRPRRQSQTPERMGCDVAQPAS